MSWEEKDGEGLWKRLKNTVTGEESIKLHEPKLIKQWCADELHYFEIPNPRKRIVRCTKCGIEKPFVLGIHHIKDGKIVRL